MKLTGLKVVDLSMFLPGPHLTMMMADHGAEVIRVEPFAGEPVRDVGLKQAGFSVWFRNTHRGKRSLRLNLKAPEGKELLLRLLKEADVFVEAFRPGVVERLGIGYETVKSLNPAIVYCSISAFGQTGPYRDRPAHDLAVEALSGLVACNLGQDGKPASPHMPVADMAGSLMALSGILMALYRRATTGSGDYIDIAMLDSQLAWTPNVTGPIFAENRANDVKQERSWGGNAFFRLYECADGQWVALGGAEHKFAENFLNAVGAPDMIPFAHEPPGPKQDPLKEFLARTFKTKPRDEWIAFCAKIDVAFAPVLNLKEAFDDPNTRAREMLLHDEYGIPHIGVPIKFAAEPARPRFTLPELGADSESIAREIGYSPDEIEKLKAAKAI
jgi:crotonobetainyl-CoA:carnitine CoA-transferase CaiB-like acyl-CoA transferase